MLVISYNPSKHNTSKGFCYNHPITTLTTKKKKKKNRLYPCYSLKRSFIRTYSDYNL